MCTKKCSKCKSIKSIDDFYPDFKRPDKLRPDCKVCNSASNKIWADKNKEKIATTSRLTHLQRRYGLTPDDYLAMYEDQGGCCAICGSDEYRGEDKCSFAIDHCHNTGEIRGLLCNKCNGGIGMLGDNPKLTKRATEYLLNPPARKY